MKLTFSLLLLGIFCRPLLALEMADLSMKSSYTCKRSSNAPPYRIIHKHYPASGTRSNHPFSDAVDINADGWCDWASMAAKPPHRGDSVEPKMEDFIFLGTKNGWRKFGRNEKLRSGRNKSENISGVLAPDIHALNFIAPVFVYSTTRTAPYVVALSLDNDLLDTVLEDINVYKWDDKFDMLRRSGAKEQMVVIDFLKKEFCNEREKYIGEVSVRHAICGKQTLN